MTDKVEEKSAEEVLADVVKTEVAAVAETKADKADLEGLAKSEDISSVEGFVKSEQLDELKSKLDEMSATMAAAPAINKGVAMDDGYFKWDGELDLNGQGNRFNKTAIDVIKAFDGTTNITGAPTASQRLYYAMQQMNPFRGVSTIMPTSATAVNLPQVTGITAQAEAAIPSSINTSTGHGGDIANATVVPQNWTSRTAFSDQSVADLPSLDMMVGAFMGQQIAVAEAVDMVSQLDTPAFPASNVVNLAGGNLDDLGVASMADLVASLSSAYKPNARFMMSREALQRLRQTPQAGTGSDLLVPADNGNFSFWGFPIIVNDHMSDGAAVGDHPIYFGDFRAGTILVSRKEMSISRHEDTIPGAMYYYGNMRSRGVLWDVNALTRLNITA